MKLSRKWLNEYTKIDAPSKEYADVMTQTGSKVELTHEPSEEIRNVVAGRVVSIERHPDADTLWVCQVDVGKEAPVQIVTGAQNVRAGDFVPVALHKSLLPGGKKIEKGKLRGVKSEGMLVSLGELGLDTHDFPGMVEDGIMILDEEFEPGADIRPYIGADDSIAEFEITSNRPDCLSVIGLARESAAAFGTELTLPNPQVRGGAGDIRDRLSIEVLSPELCPRYTAMIVKNIEIAPSPKWMRQRLRAAGVRPINNIVDITNYVMLEYGQPMHAFDYRCLEGNQIIVRTAREGETMDTLDGTPRALTPDMLVIADAEKAVGVAGVMGGANSEITEDTQMVVFESANFYGVSIRRTASVLGMRTDASSRFEKGLDVENTLPAVLRACQLVEELGAGEALDGWIDVRAAEYTPRTLKLEPERINKLLGTDISREFMVNTLTKLGFEVADNDTVTIPSWRGDVEHYSDLAEEVARFYGYDKIEPTLYAGEAVMGGYTERQMFRRVLESAARSLGYNEIYTYSFIGRQDYEKAGLPPEQTASVRILNPLGEDTSLMRTTAIPSMLGALARNHGARGENVRLYEVAKLYFNEERDNAPATERETMILGAYGACDFYAVKGAVETILHAARVPDARFVASDPPPSYHPGRFAWIYSGDTRIGAIGQIHPAAAKNYGLPETYAAELYAAELFETRAPEPKFTPLPRFPAVTRDIAVVCDAGLEAGALIGCISKAGGKLMRECAVFDVYTGAQVPEGHKSVAFSLRFRDDARTMTDAETDALVGGILAALGTEHGAVIR